MLTRSPERFGRPSIDELYACVEREMHVTRADIIGRSRHARIVRARERFIVLCLSQTLMSTTEIAQAMGRKNHSSVCTARKRVRHGREEAQR